MPLRSVRRHKLIEGEPSVRRESQGAEQSGGGAESAGADSPAEAEPAAAAATGETEGQVIEEPSEQGSASGEDADTEEGLVGRAQPIARPSEPVKSQLDRLAEQIHGLQQQLDSFIARRSEAVSETASQQVAAIVAAAEESAAEIRASAEKDASAVRERLLADVQAEVERIRAEAQADAGRIRTEAHAEAARVREQAITEASAEIQAVCARLAEELQAAARAAIAGITGGPRVTLTTSPPPAAAEDLPRPDPEKRVSDEVEDAVDELQTAAAVLEQSLRHLRTIGAEAPSGAEGRNAGE